MTGKNNTNVCEVFIMTYISRQNISWLKTKGEELLSGQSLKPLVLTNSKVKVRNRPEKRIADYLYKHNIGFVYEPKLIIQGRTFYPDFLLPDFKIYIEYFGWLHIPSYRERTELKRKIYSANQDDCIFLYHKGSHNLELILEKELLSKNLSNKLFK